MGMKELTSFVYEAVKDRNNAISVPNAVGMAIGFGVEQLPNPFITCDELRLQATDVVMPDGDLGLSDLGITPNAVDDLAERCVGLASRMCCNMNACRQLSRICDYLGWFVEHTGIFSCTRT